MSTVSVMPSSHLILCHRLLLLPPIPPSIRVFSNKSTLHMRWPKYWSFSFSISPSNEHPGLIFFRMDWLDLLAVQGPLKSLLQHHSSKASVLQHSAFFMGSQKSQTGLSDSTTNIKACVRGDVSIFCLSILASQDKDRRKGRNAKIVLKVTQRDFRPLRTQEKSLFYCFLLFF